MYANTEVWGDIVTLRPGPGNIVDTMPTRKVPALSLEFSGSDSRADTGCLRWKCFLKPETGHWLGLGRSGYLASDGWMKVLRYSITFCDAITRRNDPPNEACSARSDFAVCF